MRTNTVRSLALAAYVFSVVFTACDTKVDDAMLTARVKTQITADGRVSPSRVNVDTLNGIVMLKGEVPTQQEKDAAAEVARKVEGVVRVDNQLIVNPAVAGTGLPTGNEMKEQAREVVGSAAQEVKEEAKETVLQGVIKTRLIAAGYSSVSVDVNQGQAVMTGDVPSDKDRIAAEAIVGKVEGVTRVINQTTVNGVMPRATPIPTPRR